MSSGPTFHNAHVKSVPEVLADLKSELVEFFSTRVAMLVAELRQNLQNLKLALPMVVVGLAVIWTAWLLFTALLVVVIGGAFQPRPWAYAAALLIVAVVYLAVGSLALMSGLKRLVGTSLKPERTIRVLERDTVWIQEERREVRKVVNL
jgi:uncharacterized membrane protein YqjE